MSKSEIIDDMHLKLMNTGLVRTGIKYGSNLHWLCDRLADLAVQAPEELRAEFVNLPAEIVRKIGG